MNTRSACESHCDHQIGSTHQGMWCMQEYRCCRCGREYEHTYKSQGGWFSGRGDAHGPYAPIVTVTM